MPSLPPDLFEKSLIIFPLTGRIIFPVLILFFVGFIFLLSFSEFKFSVSLISVVLFVWDNTSLKLFEVGINSCWPFLTDKSESKPFHDDNSVTETLYNAAILWAVSPD